MGVGSTPAPTCASWSSRFDPCSPGSWAAATSLLPVQTVLHHQVSILVLLDHGRRRHLRRHDAALPHVSILVLLDHGRRRWRTLRPPPKPWGFDPCSPGSWASAARRSGPAT